MKLDISKESDREISQIIEKLLSVGFKQIDEQCVEIKTKFISGDKEEKMNIYLALFPKLLFYDDKIVPWICMEYECEVDPNNDNKIRSICKFIQDRIEKSGLKLFKDEDSYNGYFLKSDRKGWCQLRCFTNLDYKDGHWTNHTLM